MCLATPRTDAARARHMHNMWKLPDDPTRCDNVLAARPTNVPLIRALATPTSDPIIAIARRPPSTWQAERRARACYAVLDITANTDEARDMTLL